MIELVPFDPADLPNDLDLTALLQHPDVQSGIADGHLAFQEEYEVLPFENPLDNWTVNELTQLADESSLLSRNLEKNIIDAYILEQWVQGTPVRRVYPDELAKHRERLGRQMWYYGLGFLLGFVDQGLRPAE